jgi:hypothetical protein
MANDISGNPWSLDTVGNIARSPVHIKNLVWANGVTDGDALLIQDNVGRDILRAKWVAAGNNNFGVFSWVEGFNLVTLGSGKIFVVIHK